jgi:hypothetical protein
MPRCRSKRCHILVAERYAWGFPKLGVLQTVSKVDSDKTYIIGIKVPLDDRFTKSGEKVAVLSPTFLSFLEQHSIPLVTSDFLPAVAENGVTYFVSPDTDDIETLPKGVGEAANALLQSYLKGNMELEEGTVAELASLAGWLEDLDYEGHTRLNGLFKVMNWHPKNYVTMYRQIPELKVDAYISNQGWIR